MTSKYPIPNTQYHTRTIQLIGLKYAVRISKTKIPNVIKKLIMTNTTERYMYG